MVSLFSQNFECSKCENHVFVEFLPCFPVLLYEWNTSINDSFWFLGVFLLGIISLKRALLFNGGRGFVFSWGLSFLSGGCPMVGGIGIYGGLKKHKMGVHPMLPTMRNHWHLFSTIKNMAYIFLAWSPDDTDMFI